MIWMGISTELKDKKMFQFIVDELDKEILWFENVDDLKKQVPPNEKGVLLMSADIEGEEIYNFCRQFSIAYPFISIVVFSREQEVDVRQAIRSGAYDVVTYQVTKQQLMDTLLEAESFAGTETGTKTPKKTARVITICSTKGGVGKTTFSVNLACAIGKQSKKVLVIDLDLQFGDVSMFFDRKPKRTIYEWTKQDGENTFEKLKSYIVPVNDNVEMIPAPLRPEFSEAITEEHINRLITKVKPYYDVVIIDTAPFMEEKILTALEQTDEIFVVTILDLPTLKNTKIFLDTLHSLSLKGKVRVVVSRAAKRNAISIKEAETAMGMPIFLSIPDEAKVVSVSVNEGSPFIYSSPGSKIAKLVFGAANELFETPKPVKKSLFSRRLVPIGRS